MPIVLLRTVAAIAGLCVTIGVWTWLRAVVAERQFQPAGQMIRSPRWSRAHVVDRGSGPPILLLHGNPGSVNDFTPGLLDVLARSHRVVAIDRPGHGYSARPSGSRIDAEEQASLIHDVLERLGVERPIVVAHSWSGSVALALTVRHPGSVAGLVLIGAMTQPAAGAAMRHRLLAAPVAGAFLRWVVWPWRSRAAVKANLQQAYAPDLPQPDHLAQAVALWSRPSQVGAASVDFLTVRKTLRGLRDGLELIDVPVVLLYGTLDPWCRYEQQVGPTLALLPHARAIGVPSAGHELAITHVAEVADAVATVSTESIQSR